jgi:hypothetical protein
MVALIETLTPNPTFDLTNSIDNKQESNPNLSLEVLVEGGINGSLHHPFVGLLHCHYS